MVKLILSYYLNQKMQEQLHTLRIQELFTPQNNTSLSYFYASNKIISNPTLILDFLSDFSQYSSVNQENILTQINNLLATVSINAYTLNLVNTQERSQKDIPDIIQLVIELLPNYSNNYIIFSKLLAMLDHLLKVSNLSHSIMNRAIQKVAIQYYSISQDCLSDNSQMNRKHLFSTTNLIKSYFNAKLNSDKQPSKMLVFNGRRGLEIQNHQKQNTWVFGHGMSIYFWINLENIKHGSEAPLPKLFTFYSPNNGGLECYLIDNKVHYRALGSKYSQPQIGSNGLFLGQIQPKKWCFFGIQHQTPKKLLGRSHINFYLNQKKSTFHLSPPSISSKQKMKIILFDRIYCKSSSICIFPKYAEPQLYTQFYKNKNSIDIYKNNKCYIFEERQGKLYERKGQLGYCLDSVLSKDRNLVFDEILPLFRMLKYVSKPEDSLLNQLLHLFVLYLMRSQQNQITAENKNYLQIIAELIKDISNLQEIFTSETIGVLLHIKQSITSSQLLTQYYGDFLWPIIDSTISIYRKQQILEIIKNNFTQNISYFSTIIGLDQMINMIFKLEKTSVRCCQKHFKIIAKRFPVGQNLVSFETRLGETEIALDYILKMIELYIQTEKFSAPTEIYKLCRLLSFSNKFSPCFTSSLLELLRKIFTQKLTEKLNNSQSKKIFEFLTSKKVYLLFLYVIENSFFAEIKAESVKIIYAILMKRAPVQQQKEISHRIAKALWKINEENAEHKSQQNQRESEENQMVEPIDEEHESRSKKSSNIKIDEQIGEKSQKSGLANQEESYKQVGPQAPKLSNKLKGNKNFNFSFMSETNSNTETSPTFELPKKSKLEKKRRFSEKITNTESVNNKQVNTQIEIGGLAQLGKKKNKLGFTEEKQESHKDPQSIMEEEKTNENQLTNQLQYYPQQPSKKEQQKKVIKLKKPGLALSIDTDEINKMFSFGGEKGQQIIVTQQQQKEELNRIRRLAKICVAKMNGEDIRDIKDLEENQGKQEEIKSIMPPPTTSNKMLKLRDKNPKPKKKLQNLKFIAEQQQSLYQSAKKSTSFNQKNTSFSYPLPSPNYTKKSKSPNSITKIIEENMIVLYNSLIECCVGAMNYEIEIPSVLFILFNWIPQTNLEAKFIMDLLLIMDNDEKQEKIRAISGMPELYDFLLELTYKGLLFEQMQQQLCFMKRLDELIQKIYGFVFRNDPEFIQKVSFIFEWSKSKASEYHPRCLFFTGRYVFQIMMGTIEESLFTNGCDKLCERNFQHLGMLIEYFCKFLPIEEDETIFIDQFQRVMFSSDFKIIPSIAPCFTSSWADYLICEKYYLLFKKFLCTDWYSKSLKNFKNLKISNITGILSQANTTLSSLQLPAEAQYYLKNSFIFFLFEINRYIFIEKTLSHDIRLSSSVEQNEASQLIWQTIFIVIIAEFNKQKNQKNNSEFVVNFVKSCKTLKDLEVAQSVIIIPFILQTREYYRNVSTSPMTGSGLFSESHKQKNPNSSIKPTGIYIESLIQNYINQNLFVHEGQSPHYDFEAFKLNFEHVALEQPQQITLKQITKQFYDKFMNDQHIVDELASDFIEDFTTILEQENARFKCTEILLETSYRKARSDFRKIWKNLRIFGGPWTHSEMKLQKDMLFNKNSFTYERYEASHLYKWRIAKHNSKCRLRFLLKPILQQPLEKQKPHKQNLQQSIKDKDEIGLNRAIAYYCNNKLLLGNRVLIWLLGKNSENIETIMGFKKVRLIKTLTIRHGYLGIMNQKLLFINAYHNQPQTHLSISEYKIQKNKAYYKIWPLEFVKQIFKRRYINRKRALEITFIHGKSIMLEFYENQQQEFLKKILKLKGTKCPNLTYNGHKSLDSRKMYESEGLNKKWNTYEITNFEYLMELNNLAGRSYADLTQYPVYPWVLINFDDKIKMSEPENYRDLSLPLGALGSQNRTEGFRDRFEHMAEIEEQRFHYGTHYSSPGIIYHFLVRISPFTQGSILLQSGKFDFADRMFFSIADSYKNATSEYSDVRQLVPQLYTIPQFYLNINKLDMGIMQNEKRVHNVELPPWARENPYLYVTKLRRAFEESVVSKNINKWIDLIFGYKQRGEQAEKNLNCFVHLTYEDSVNFDAIKQKKTITAIETQILNFGQTPSQLFVKPHTQRSPITSSLTYGMICDQGIEPKVYRPTRHSNKDLLFDDKNFNAMNQPEDSIIHMKWFKDSKLVFIRKKGQMMSYKWHSKSSTNKAPFQCQIQRQKYISLITKKMLIQSLDYSYDPSLVTESFPIQFFNHGHYIALGGLIDGKLLIIDADNNTVVETHNTHLHTICHLKSDTNNNFLITGDITGRIIIWRITISNKLIFYHEMKDHIKQITNIFISYDLRLFFTAGEDGVVYGYNILTGKKMKVYYHPKRLPVSNIVVSTCPLAILVMFCNQQSMIYSYSINGQLVQRLPETNVEHFLSAILIKDSNGFQHVAYGNQNGQVFLRALPFLDNLSKYPVAKNSSVNKVCLSKSGKSIITGCSDGQLSVLTVPDQQQ